MNIIVASAPIAANKTQTGQNKGGDTTVSFTTTKALRDAVAKKQALSNRNQQAGKAQVIFDSTTCEYF